MKVTKRRVITSLVITLMISILFIPACQKEQPKPKIIKIGAILPLTGNLAWVGIGEKNGMELAKQKINKEGGIIGKKLEIIYEDSQADPKLAAAAAQKLIDVEGIKFIIASTTGCANVVIPIVEKENALEFAVTIDPDITNRSGNVFRIWASDDQQWKLLSEYLVENQSQYKNIGIIRVNNEYGVNAKKAFDKSLSENINIAFDEDHPLGEKDYRNIISKIKGEKLDGIVLIEYANDLITLVKQLKESDINIQLFGNIDFIFDFVKKQLFELADGVIFTAPGFSIGDITPLGEQFIAQYKENFQAEPSWNEAYSFDNIAVIAEAIKKANSVDPLKVKDTLFLIKDFPGVTGNITILNNGDSLTTLYLVQYRDQNVQPIHK